MTTPNQICPNCGASADPDKRFCEMCGQLLKPPAGGPVPAQPPNPPPPPMYQQPSTPPVQQQPPQRVSPYAVQQPRKKNTWIWIVVAVVVIGGLLCLAAVILGGMAFSRGLVTDIQSTVEAVVPGIEEQLGTVAVENFVTPEPVIEATEPVAEAVPTRPARDLTQPTAPSGAGSGRQEVTETYLFDDFSSDKLGWYVNTDEIAFQGYENDAYIIHIYEPEYVAWSFVPVEFYPTTIEFDAVVEFGISSGTYGVMCNYQNDENYFYVELDPVNGEYAVGQYLNGEYLSLIADSWASTSNFRQSEGEVNHYTISCNPYYMNLFINDQFEVDVALDDPSIQAGDMALFAFTWDQMDPDGIRVRFDDVNAYIPQN